jgi:formylglycine-generating enzyme required for sulfatase activity
MERKTVIKTACALCLMALSWLPMSGQNAPMRGDVDGNQAVNVTDAIVLLNYLQYNDASMIDMTAADVNYSNSVDISDVIELINYLINNVWTDVPYEPVIETFTVGDVTFNMVKVTGGTFMMGASDDDALAKSWEKPRHEVTLSDYYIGETEVTQGLWKAVMGSNPSWFQYAYESDYAYTDDLTRPVERVTYANVQSFLTKLKQKTGKTFRLPTEAEWEFAARGGNYSKGYTFPGSDDIDEVAWHTGNSSLYVPNADRYENMPHPVGTKAPNELGIYDMGGNVAEWTSDWYGLYSDAAVTNPTGPASGTARVVRGGSWGQAWRMNRVSYRYEGFPTSPNVNTGLRLVLVP